jgi:transposase, IS5 family
MTQNTGRAQCARTPDPCNKVTRRDKFLADMEQVVPWARLEERLRPFYPRGERGRPPLPLDRMLRVYFVQQWYGLADEAVEDAFGACPRA